ncbi:ABC transporter permease [Cupriavidus basilensis]|uniref:ABC transporter permease n=1 Tax=Cupriavidus basilensis TaxID=68895 RepID=A0ABT6AXF4_9BURK|nr:ABC transporter permease [Cupriavidus basilensis]MDF3837273.1 ABC transporter permease [Cupriavidus basilensis]
MADTASPRAAFPGHALRRLLPRGLPWFACLVFALLLACAIGGDALLAHDPNGLDLGLAFQPPAWLAGGDWSYPLGTDNMGRDVLARIMAGTRISLVAALYAIALSGGIGTAVGMVAGYFGGRADALIMRLVDIQMSIPSLALALVLAAVLGPGFETVVLVIVITYWTWYARIVRGEVMSLKERDYVALARVAGCGTLVIFRRHLLPNLLNTLLVLATLQVGQVIIFEASLSFLGLGIQQPDVSWGLMLADARNYITNAWWVITMPGLAIMATCLASNLLGDWLRDHFDPRRRQL